MKDGSLEKGSRTYAISLITSVLCSLKKRTPRLLNA